MKNLYKDYISISELGFDGVQPLVLVQLLQAFARYTGLCAHSDTANHHDQGSAW